MGAVYVGCRGHAGVVFGEGVNPHSNLLPQGEETDGAQLLLLPLPVGEGQSEGISAGCSAGGPPALSESLRIRYGLM